MVASDTPVHNFFRRLICPRTTVVRTRFYPVTGRHVKSALLNVISLARLACVHTWA